MSTIDLDFYAVVKADVIQGRSYCNGKPSVRVCKGRPNLDHNEVPVLISLSIPMALFLRPQISAKITIPDQDINNELSVEVQSDIVDAIKKVVGMNVTLNVEQAELNHD